MPSNRGHQAWLLQLLVQVEAAGPGRDPEVCTYQPCSDFLIQKSSLLRLAIEVNSTASDRPPKDQHRLMIQGASIVKLANTSLGAYKEKKSFIFVAIYIHNTGLTDRYLLYQKRESDTVSTRSV
jgi:hypothetical protein